MYVAIDADDSRNRIERTQFATNDGKLGKGAGAGGVMAFLDGAVEAYRALNDAARGSGNDSSEKEQIADTPGGKVVATWCGRVRQDESQFAQFFLCFHRVECSMRRVQWPNSPLSPHAIFSRTLPSSGIG